MPRRKPDPGKHRMVTLIPVDLHSHCVKLAARKRTNVTTEVIAALLAHLEAAGIDTGVKP